jgi:hypothetical protein
MKMKQDSFEKVAQSISLSKLKSIAERLRAGQEPTIDEANYAQKFVKTIPRDSVIYWLEQLLEVMDSDGDRQRVSQFIANLKGN